MVEIPIQVFGLISNQFSSVVRCEKKRSECHDYIIVVTTQHVEEQLYGMLESCPLRIVCEKKDSFGNENCTEPPTRNLEKNIVFIFFFFIHHLHSSSSSSSSWFLRCGGSHVFVDWKNHDMENHCLREKESYDNNDDTSCSTWSHPAALSIWEFVI